MKILVVGNLGYTGPTVNKTLRKYYPSAEIIGLDTGYFAHILTNPSYLAETNLNRQIYADVHEINEDFLKNNDLLNLDVVIYLAALSNNDMGDINKDITMTVNYKCAVKLAGLLKQNRAGKMTRFVYASSCSVYGDASGAEMQSDGSRVPITELDGTNPLTAYAVSKLEGEKELAPLASNDFQISCLRFATVCGMSDRLALDLFLNDFIAGGVTEGKITVLTDGSPWRPLLHVNDYAKAVAWFVQRENEKGGNFLIVNIGSNVWNYKILDFALACEKYLDGVEVSVNKDVTPNVPSYRVNFDKFASLAPEEFLPSVTLEQAVKGLEEGIKNSPQITPNYRKESLIRFITMQNHLKNNRINSELFWNK